VYGRAVMDRGAWLAERRAAVVATYDDEASGYGADPYPISSHEAFVARLLATCPAGGVVLDAPCGAGRYFGLVRASGRRVVGVDQSAGMLEQARRYDLAEAVHHVGLQELEFEDAFDGSMTIDAMENIPPEDWPLVLANLRRAVHAGGHLYLTVEDIDDADIDAAYADGMAAGLPVVRGEVIEGDVAGYHFYPGRAQVLRWFESAGLEVEDEAFDREDDWGYRHWLLRAPRAAS
jgi:cyclopropane fatty-acyl-phospholipid synthase-like methyltransferase